jgi:hypothetical protein
MNGDTMTASADDRRATGVYKPLILIEFNELTPHLMFSFMKSGHLPNFQRLYDQSEVFTTDAEEEGEDLNPWVQWVTVHSGLSAAEHGIHRLSEGHTLQSKAVWDILSDEGYRVWVCGSMNARYDKPLRGFLLPDPWSAGLTPFPPREFSDYYDFVRNQVQEHTNTSQGVSKLGAVRFLRFMATHGLSAGSIVETLRQLSSERFGTGRWKRASLMDRFQFDVFQHYFSKHRPHFSTFFVNSTAHYQHSYWRHMDPDSYTVRPSEAEQREYGGAILYGYQKMDELIGRFMKLAGADGTLFFCTGLSQQPYLKAETTGGRHYFRLVSSRVLKDKIGIQDPFEASPVMSDQMLLRFADDEACARAEQVLRSYKLLDSEVFYCQRTDNTMMVQCQCTTSVASDAELRQADSDRRVPFFDVFYSMDVIKSGYHHPDGMLWVRRPTREHVVHAERTPIKTIASMALEHFGLSSSLIGTPPEAESLRLV